MDASEALTLEANQRTAVGKKNRALRRNGITPFHMYGLTDAPASLQADTHTLRLILRAAGYTTPVTVKVAGGEEAVTVVRGIDVHPVSGDLVHVDFMRVDITEAIEVNVPIVLINDDTAPVTRIPDVSVTQAVHEITVSALPYDVPHEIEVDCMSLTTLDDVIHARDIVLPPNVALASDPDQAIAWGEEARVTSEEDLTPAEEGEEAEAGAEAEGETAEDGEKEESSGESDES